MSGKTETSSHQVARHSGEVCLTARIGNTAKVRSDDKTFDWTLFVESNDREIAGVRCELHHRTFRQPIVQMVPSDKTRMRWELKSAGAAQNSKSSHPPPPHIHDLITSLTVTLITS